MLRRDERQSCPTALVARGPAPSGTPTAAARVHLNDVAFDELGLEQLEREHVFSPAWMLRECCENRQIDDVSAC